VLFVRKSNGVLFQNAIFFLNFLKKTIHFYISLFVFLKDQFDTIEILDQESRSLKRKQEIE